MNGGLFITLYDEKTLALYLRYGIYGFLMKPVYEDQPSSRSKHYAALADYACSREGTHVFFFINRKIVYGGKTKGNDKIASFYLNGNTSPLGRKADASLFWDESERYIPTDNPGVFKVKGSEKAQPFILQFEKIENRTNKQISSDDLYFELGQFPYPLPSNTIQGMSFCTLTPGETEMALNLLDKSKEYFDTQNDEQITKGEKQTLFKSSLLNYKNFQNEAHIEFTLLADLEPIQHLLANDDYILCRQVPISPFKPFNMDRADICLYSFQHPIKNGTIPNVVIEIKKDRANYSAYNQMVRYLKWLEKITVVEEFARIQSLIVAPAFYTQKKKVDLIYENKIKMYSLEDKAYHLLG